MKIGVVGYSKANIDEDAARAMLMHAFGTLLAINPKNSPIEIVSGLTNIGIPKLAYQIADELGLTKIGISAERALHVKCGIYNVDKQIIKGEIFGDESVIFIEYIDALIRIGGGKQSHQEVNMFIKKCTEQNISIDNYLIQYELSLLE